MNDLNEFIRQFTEEDILHVKDGERYYFKHPDVETAKAMLEDQPLAPSILLGTKKKHFKPTLFLLEQLSKKSSNKVFINNKAEWLFLCGRDVFEDNISKDNSTAKIFLVQNERDENLGYAMKMKDKGNTIIRNLLDRGDFLRRENH